MPNRKKRRGPVTPAERKAILDMRGGNMRASEVAAEFGLSASAVYNIWGGWVQQHTPRPRKEGARSGAAPSGGGDVVGLPAAAPSRMEASLIARGMRPEMARLTARAFQDRHARIMAERGR